MNRKSDDLDKWVAILSKLAQSENGSSDDEQLGLSFYAIRSSAVSDYYKLTELLERMVEKGVIEVIEEVKTNPAGEEKEIRRYKITKKGIELLFEILIPARNALRRLE